jgi:hypothetical protein
MQGINACLRRLVRSYIVKHAATQRLRPRRVDGVCNVGKALMEKVNNSSSTDFQ